MENQTESKKPNQDLLWLPQLLGYQGYPEGQNKDNDEKDTDVERRAPYKGETVSVKLTSHYQVIHEQHITHTHAEELVCQCDYS